MRSLALFFALLVILVGCKSNKQEINTLKPIKSKIMRGITINGAAEVKYIIKPSLTCAAPRLSSGLVPHVVDKGLIGIGHCVEIESFYWDGIDKNSTKDALDSFDIFIKAIKSLGGRIDWRQRNEADLLYLGIVYRKRYCFIIFHNNGLKTVLDIVLTDYKS